MSDIVNRLRLSAKLSNYGGTEDELNEAANKIEVQANQLAMMEHEANKNHAIIKRLRAQVPDRDEPEYKAALELKDAVIEFADQYVAWFRAPGTTDASEGDDLLDQLEAAIKLLRGAA